MASEGMRAFLACVGPWRFMTTLLPDRLCLRPSILSGPWAIFNTKKDDRNWNRRAIAIYSSAGGTAPKRRPWNPQIVDGFAGRKQFAHPTGLSATTGPCLVWWFWISKLWKNLRIGSTDRGLVGGISDRAPQFIEPLFK